MKQTISTLHHYLRLLIKPWPLTDKRLRVLSSILKKCWIALAVLLAAFAIVFTLFRALTPWVKQYKVEVEQHLSSLLGQSVKIQDLETSWYWFQPVLKMDQLTLVDTNQQVLKLNKLLVGINLWDSLWSWQIKPGLVYAEDVHLTVHEIDGHWDVNGLQANSQSMTFNKDSYLPLVGWLLAQHTTLIKHFSADIYFADGSVLPLEDFNVKGTHAGGHYRLFANAKLNQKKPTKISIIADLELDPNALHRVSGRAYVSLHEFLPIQWQPLLSNTPYQVKQGECDVEAWVDIQQGQIIAVQSMIELNHLIWKEKQENKTHQIDVLNGNFAWKKVKQGWQLTADQIKLQMDHINWPENELQIEYKQSTETYRLFVKKLSMASILAEDIAWPNEVSELLKLHPSGELYDTQLHLKQHQLAYFLTRFEHVGWDETKKIPGVHDISGVLYWEPTAGRLVLDGEQTKVSAYQLPPLTFDLFNLDIDWKTLAQGFRVSMDRFVLSHPNLVLSATGALDNPDTKDANLRMSVEFAAKNAKKFLAYIPSTGFRPKFDDWLKHDIKRIGHAAGRVVVDGKLSDFPFDTAPGEFSIVSHVSGVDLLINPEWPLNRDMDADIVVNKRTFIANVDQANLKGVLLDKVNIVINDIGLGKEALLLHGNVEAPAYRIKRYIFASPLRDRLIRWKAIDIDDDLGLDLHLEIPLYPESDHVIAQGDMTFVNNPILIHLPFLPLQIQDVSGALQFNEYGLTDGGLQGTLDGLPVALHAQAIIEPKEGTVLSIEGETSADYLQQNLSAPLMHLLAGNLKFTALWTIFANDKDPDQLHLDSSLQGVSIHLPKPFGKTESEQVPLTADLVFNPDRRVGIHFNYDERVHGELLLSPKDGALILSRGEVHVGPENITLPKQAGLKLTGTLSSVDLSEWHTVLAKLPSDGSSTVWDSVHDVDLDIGQLTVLGETYDKLKLKASLSKNDWLINLNQASFAATLHYHPATKLLTGKINHLYLNPKESTPKPNEPKWHIQPEDIPNLNLTVDELKFKEIEVGSVDIKSTTHKADWSLDECLIKSPNYQLQLQGHWKKTLKQDTSTLQAHLTLFDLGKSLEQWHLTPAVDARPGNITFQGGWWGPFYDFSLSKVTGKMQIVFKNGRISHLDKRTEEKLGLGKLLSVLSLQTIPRRLKLDFSDLSENGYSFDIFKGNFVLKQGVMSTQDSYVDGPVAYARMEGDLDLSKRLYDVNLRITPYIAASLPVVATIAGGPIAGLATWVASNIINKGMQKISGYTYKISGPWLDPVVQQVSIDRSVH